MATIIDGTTNTTIAGDATVQGNFTASGNVTAYSDERYKTNWRGLPENFLDNLINVRSGVYDRIDTKDTQVGVSAQSLQQFLPEAILQDKDGNLSVAYGNAALVACIELAKEVKRLSVEIESLRKGE